MTVTFDAAWNGKATNPSTNFTIATTIGVGSNQLSAVGLMFSSANVTSIGITGAGVTWSPVTATDYTTTGALHRIRTLFYGASAAIPNGNYTLTVSWNGLAEAGGDCLSVFGASATTGGTSDGTSVVSPTLTTETLTVAGGVGDMNFDLWGDDNTVGPPTSPTQTSTDTGGTNNRNWAISRAPSSTAGINFTWTTNGNQQNSIAHSGFRFLAATTGQTFNESVSFALHPTVSDSVTGSMQAAVSFPLHPEFSGMLPSTGAIIWQADGGTITQQGLWTAPTIPGTYHITAISSANPFISQTATVVVPPVIVSVIPPSTTMFQSTTSQATTAFFSAVVTGTTTLGVTWAATTGSLLVGATTAVLTAPVSTGVLTLSATSVLDTTVVGQSSVIVQATPPPATTSPPPPPPPITYVPPLVQLQSFRQTAPLAQVTVTLPDPITAGNLLFVGEVADASGGGSAANISSISGGGVTSWVLPAGASKGMYGLSAAGGSQPVTIVFNRADTLSGFLAEFSGMVTTEPTQDGFAVLGTTSGNTINTPTLGPTTVDLGVAIFEIDSTTKNVSSPSNGFILPPGGVVTANNTACAITYKVSSAALQTAITVA